METVRLLNPWYVLTPIADGLAVLSWEPPTPVNRYRKLETWVLWRGTRLYHVKSRSKREANKVHTKQVETISEWYAKRVERHVGIVDLLLEAGWLEIDVQGNPNLTVAGLMDIASTVNNPLFDGHDRKSSVVNLSES